ncbi:MAG: extracellular solute-binding protein [Clostridia bacterium]|nr:extracellular solute-binding protein [Clostridia bacterium]
MKKSICLILSILILTSTVVCSAAPADEADPTDTPVADTQANAVTTDYEQYIKDNNFKEAKEEISVALDAFIADGATATYGTEEINWEDGLGGLTFAVNVPENALYNLEITWKPTAAGIDPSVGVKLDGQYPFAAAEGMDLKREWKNISDAPRVDWAGNEYAQEQVETGEYITSVLQDFTGMVTEPYTFALSAGDHTLTVANAEQGILIKAITLTVPDKAKAYEDLSVDYNLEANDADIITIQAENAKIKNSKSLIPKSNNSDAGMTPADPYTSKINYIGGTAWQSPGSAMNWTFNVETAGYYYIGFRYKQSELINGVSWRKLKVDGKMPFAEAADIGFPFGTEWEYYTLGEDEKSPYYIWLDAGEHEISMEVAVGAQSEYVQRLSEVVSRLGDEYIKIVMITGESPDVNRDYELFKQIDGFTETLEWCKENLNSIAADMKKLSGSGSTQSIAAIENMARVLNQMLKSPYVAQQYVKDYYNNYTSVSSWLYDMTNMPLSLDEIQVVPYGKEMDDKTPNIFASFGYGVVRLFASFIQEYSLTGDSESEKQIKIWINWGQDQAMVLNSLIKDSFTPETSIDVRVDVVSASLINGILAGNFPDLSLHLARTEPVNLGIRGALHDLTKFSDCGEVLKRFQTTSEEPYKYGDALYALPDTQSYFIMYYRKDIMEKLGLSVPTNWTEFKHAAMVIQRNNMNVYVPYTQITTATTVNTGIGSLNLLPTLMAQNGLSLYNEEKTATALNNLPAIEVFDFWTDLYTEYGYLKEAEFYNRFRVGVVPLGIAPLATYMNLYSAAPEIAGRWGVALVPASENGNRTIAGAGTGCGIIAKSSNKDEAWEFLKWWTSAETQTRYNNNVESILGMIGRTTTANVEAFQNLAWDNEHLSVMEQQRLQVREVPEVPGSYYLSRAIDQAFWTVVNGETNSKDAVMKWSKIADDEIDRKIKEYS